MQKRPNLRLLYNEKQIRARVRELADDVLKSYATDEEPILCICVLRGAVIFFSDLVKEMISDRIIFDFIRISSYGDSKTTSGKVELLENMAEDVTGKHVLIVEDIVDSGHTVKFLREYFSKLNPIDVKVASLLDKPLARKVEAAADFTGFFLKNSSFVVGYGLDYEQAYRNLNGIFEVTDKL